MVSTSTHFCISSENFINVRLAKKMCVCVCERERERIKELCLEKQSAMKCSKKADACQAHQLGSI